MKRIGLISDTHGFLDPKVFKHFESCDEIWHAGDIGTVETADALSSFRSFRAVCGNIDGHPLRSMFPVYLDFTCEGLKVLILHIGGYPGNYSVEARKHIAEKKPALFISGHSHILKVMPDRNNNLLHMNPGAAGNHGFHKIKTLLRFTIDDGKMKDAEVIELGLRGVIE